MDLPGNIKAIGESVRKIAPEIISQFSRIEVKEGGVQIKKQSYPSYEYSFIIGVTGRYKGAVTMSLKKEVAFYIASSMLGLEELKEFDETAESTLRELANMTVARSLMVVSDEGLIDLTPPTFVKGTNVFFAVADIDQTYEITFDTEVGKLEFNISLSEK